MNQPLPPDDEKRIGKMAVELMRLAYVLTAIVALVTVLLLEPGFLQSEEVAEEPTTAETEEEIVDGLHLPSGLIAEGNYQVVINNCGRCHSLQLVIQNRANRQGWKDIIDWMYKTQDLAKLGTNEELILDYLAEHYAPVEQGRRAQLTDIEWYELN